MSGGISSQREQQYADLGDYRGFYKALKAVYGLTHRDQSPLCSADGQALFTDKASILSHWSEHFQSFFSADRVVQDPAVLYIPQQLFKAKFDKLPTVKENSKAIEHLRSGKAAGVDGISLELRKEGGPALHSKLHALLVCCWEQGKLPSDLHDAIIVTLYKDKREKSDCSKYRGIIRLYIAGKILARIILNNWYPPSLKTIYQKPVWVQSQQEHHKHGVRPQTAPREMQGVEQRTVCSVCGPDQSV